MGTILFILVKETHLAARARASAAAVASSSSDALATSSAVSSTTIVWKLKRLSRRPCAISGWYGVYCVYLMNRIAYQLVLTGHIDKRFHQ